MKHFKLGKFEFFFERGAIEIEDRFLKSKETIQFVAPLSHA